MTGRVLDHTEARLLVEARLGHPPEDELEAAVVLEAWAGVPAQAALEVARELMPAIPAPPQPSVGRLPKRRSEQGVLFDELTFTLTVVAIAFWAAPLASSLGVGVVERGLIVALPLTVALQWAIRCRYLDRPQGVALLAAHRVVLAAGAAWLVALLSALIGSAGLLAGLLTVTWTGGTILIRRHRPAVYVATVVLATPAMLAGADALIVLAAAAGVTALAVGAALAGPRAAGARPSPGPLERTAVAALLGAGLGLMLVIDDSVSWTSGAVPALALVPSTIASFWAGHHLRRLDEAIPGAALGVAAGGAATRGRAAPPLGVRIVAVGRLVLLAGALSVALLALTPWLGSSARGAGVLVGFALIALATLLVGLLEALGRGPWALLAVACAVATEVSIRVDGHVPFPGTGLVAGGAVAVAVAAPMVIMLLSRPASTLATSLWIP
jgi:hypothetical protein